MTFYSAFTNENYSTGDNPNSIISRNSETQVYGGPNGIIYNPQGSGGTPGKYDFVYPLIESLIIEDGLLADDIFYSRTLIGTSDGRIKSHERDIVDATETLNKLTPKIYDKHPFSK